VARASGYWKKSRAAISIPASVERKINEKIDISKPNELRMFAGKAASTGFGLRVNELYSLTVAALHFGADYVGEVYKTEDPKG